MMSKSIHVAMIIFTGVLLLSTHALINASVCSAQSKLGVSMKRDKAQARIYVVTYVPPAGSAFASAAFDDTVFCASVVNTMHGVHDIVHTMTRVDSALYITTLKFPDSTYSVMLDVCLPTEQLPDGDRSKCTGNHGQTQHQVCTDARYHRSIW